MNPKLRPHISYMTTDGVLFGTEAAAEEHQERVDLHAFLARDGWWSDTIIDPPAHDDLRGFPEMIVRVVSAFPRIRDVILTEIQRESPDEVPGLAGEGALMLARKLNESAARISVLEAELAAARSVLKQRDTTRLSGEDDEIPF